MRNHSHELSNSSFSSTRPIVSNFPKDNDHIDIPIQKHNPGGHTYDSDCGISNYPKGNNHLEHIAGLTYSPEENVSAQQVNNHIVTSIAQDHNPSFCSNEISLSSCIPILDSSQSPSILTSKATFPLLDNDHPMLTRATTGKSKPKAYISHTESEPTSGKKVVNKPEWAKAMRDEFNAL